MLKAELEKSCKKDDFQGQLPSAEKNEQQSNGSVSETNQESIQIDENENISKTAINSPIVDSSLSSLHKNQKNFADQVRTPLKTNEANTHAQCVSEGKNKTNQSSEVKTKKPKKMLIREVSLLANTPNSPKRKSIEKSNENEEIVVKRPKRNRRKVAGMHPTLLR